MPTTKIQRSRLTGISSPQGLKTGLCASNWKQTNQQQTCNKQKNNYLPHLHVFPSNCPAGKKHLHTKLSVSWTPGVPLPALQETSLQYSPGKHLSSSNGPECFTIFVYENILIKRGKWQHPPPPKNQRVTAESCLQRQSPKKF